MLFIYFTFVYISIFIAIMLNYIYNILPSPLEPVLWKDPSPLLKFSGRTMPNNILTNSIQIKGKTINYCIDKYLSI